MKNLFFLLALLLAVNVKAELKISKIFSDNMVLQRGMPVPVWGWSKPKEKVTVIFKGQTKSIIADNNGRWILKLAPLAVSQVPDKMTVKTNEKTKIFTNVLVGDVWLCSGQSNMGEDFSHPLNSKYPPGKKIAAELKKINNPLIRIVDRKGLGKIIPVAHEPPAFPYFGWQECNSKTAKYFSRVGYYFGEKLQKELKIPIGLVNVSRGCSSIEAWMPPEAFKSDQRLEKQFLELKKIQNFYRNYNQCTKQERGRILLEHCNSKYGGFSKRCYMKNGKLPYDKYDKVLRHMLVVKPASLFYHAIHSIIPFAFKGVIWYQGETNVASGDTEYALKQRLLIESWRNLWRQGNFPFYIVQLAPCLDGRDAALPGFWLQQYKAVQDTANTGLISAVDIGNFNEYHPENKWDVGHRLAFLALHETYGRKDIIASGPMYKSLDIEGYKVKINFDHTGSGLTTNNGKAPNWFEIAGSDKKFVKAKAKIEKNKVVISNSTIKKPVFVRYAWSSRAHTNLCNKEGLPAFPFNTAEPFFQNNSKGTQQ